MSESGHDLDGPAGAEHERLYTPEPGEAQLTARAVLTGCCLGAVVASMNIYFGLKTGWSIGGSLIAAILGFSVWTMFHHVLGARKYSVLETNITQTSGSAAGSMTSTAGLLAAVPALGLLGTDLSYFELAAWAASVAFLGVFFAVPLRNQMVVVEKLRFPTGTATAETIVSMFAKGSTALAQAKYLLTFAIFAGAFTILMYFVSQVGHPPFEKWVTLAADNMAWLERPELWLTVAAAWGFSLLISPLMFGAGILIGPRIGISLLLGAIVSWAILGPVVAYQGWTTSDPEIMATIAEDGWIKKHVQSYAYGPRGWILWPGVAIMIADALTNLALSWKTILNTFRPSKTSADLGMEDEKDRVPNSWWLIGLAIGSTLTIITAWFIFGIPWWMTVIAIAMSSVLAMIAVRSTGETDINPIGGMGKVTQLVFGAVAPGNTTTNLMAAGITGAGASQAGDMMHDLKAGRLLGATPRKQIIAQCCGIAAGIPIATGIYTLFNKAYEIGIDEEMPAPAAHAWKAMAELLSEGLSAMPTNAPWAVLAGALFGMIIPILRKSSPKLAPYLPSGLAFGIAFIVPAYYSIAMFLGSMMLVVWRKTNAKGAAVFSIAVASGLIAGEGLMGIVNAVMTLLEVPTLTG